jgi:uncharacterized membrane protein YGL010W
MLGGRTSEQWIAQYAGSHQHPVNRVCHAFGIPMIVVSVVWLLIALITSANWHWPALLFVLGWVLQFLGHAFERKLPEFFHDWRFLLVGMRWWWTKIVRRGHA